MAKLIVDDQEFEIPDGSHFVEQAETAGVPFGCSEGVCGSCKVTVLEGEECLSPRTNEEEDFGLLPQERLACQCKLRNGCCRLKYF